MLRKYLLLTGLLFCSFNSFSQLYIEGGNTRHRFAQLTIGTDLRSFLPTGSYTSFINSPGLMEKRKLSVQSEGRIIIGGTHFWGHADFYIAIPVASLGKSGFTSNVETGAKYFPWQIQDKKLRPYIGMAWMPVSYKQGEGAEIIRHRFPLTSGLAYNSGQHLIELGAGYIFKNSEQYYINTSTATLVKMHSLWISLGYKFMIDGTLSAEKNWENGKTKMLTDTLAKMGRLNGFTLAIGPSSAFYLKRSAHNDENLPWLDNHKISSVFPEFGIGYYLHKPDLHFNIAYRNIPSTMEAYAYKQEASRKAVTFEMYKFIADYHGFVPFLGITLSREYLKVEESDQAGVNFQEDHKSIKPGVIFGWDIRPDRLQAFYLRTNLRWAPGLNVKMKSEKNFNFDQLEFNFIQLVVFPGRIF